MRVHFIEKKHDLFQTDDGRFQMTRTQTSGGHKFTVTDIVKNQNVGAPKSMTKAVSLVRHYLLTEKQAQENPTTMPKARLGDNVVPLPQPPPAPAEVRGERFESALEPKSSRNSQLIMAHLASIANEEGMFSTYRGTISKETGLAWTHVDYWLNKFIAMEWVVELEKEADGRPGSYGFNMSSEEVQNLIRNMPSRIVTRPQQQKAEPRDSAQPASAAGVMAGKAMVRISALEQRLETFMRETTAALDCLRAELAQKEKPDVSGFEGVLDYLETSQQRVNEFISETFGVKIL